MGSRSRKRKKQLETRKPSAQRADAHVSEVTTKALVQEMTASWSGPIPHPNDLARYEAMAPGSATLMIESALAQQVHVRKQEEIQSDHRRSLEIQFLNGNERRSNIGLWTAFVIAMFGIIAGVLFGTIGHDAKAGAATVAVVFSGGALVYFLGAKPAKRESN